MNDGDKLARSVLWRAARCVQDSDTKGATAIIFDACIASIDDVDVKSMVDAVQRASTLIVVGAELCAVALRKAAGDPHPTCYNSELFYSMEVSTLEGLAIDFDDVDTAPSAVTALRCISAGLNRDFDLLSSVLKAHVHVCGVASVFEVVGDLINYYIAFADGEIDEKVFDSA